MIFDKIFSLKNFVFQKIAKHDVKSLKMAVLKKCLIFCVPKVYVFTHFFNVEIFRDFRFKTIFLAPLWSVFFVIVKNTVLYRILQCIRRVGCPRLCRNYLFFNTFRAVLFSFFPFDLSGFKKKQVLYCILHMKLLSRKDL